MTSVYYLFEQKLSDEYWKELQQVVKEIMRLCKSYETTYEPYISGGFVNRLYHGSKENKPIEFLRQGDIDVYNFNRDNITSMVYSKYKIQISLNILVNILLTFYIVRI